MDLRVLLHVIVAAILIGVAADANAFRWMRNSVLIELEESDWEIIQPEARRVLDSVDDGVRVDWNNEATGNRGAFKVIMSFRIDGQPCRRIAILTVNNKGQRDVMKHNVCRQNDGTWKFVSDSAATGEE